MNDPVPSPAGMIYVPGTRVIIQFDERDAQGRVIHSRGSVGVVVRSPDPESALVRVRFMDGSLRVLSSDQILVLAPDQEDQGAQTSSLPHNDFYDRIIFRAVIGSHAYGLTVEGSDTDRRGVYLPRAEQHWSFAGVPEQLEYEPTQEVYWELEKFLTLALKANPNVLECLYSPIIEMATPLGRELLALRSIFLSRLVYQTYNGYAHSQFKKMQNDQRLHGTVKWKHVMHLIRLLLAGIGIIRDGCVPVTVSEHREQLLAIRQGQMPMSEIEAWRTQLQLDFAALVHRSQLPEQPDYRRAEEFLLAARRRALEGDLP